MAALKRNKRNKNRRMTRRAPRIEQLEARNLMAVNLAESTFNPEVFENNMDAIFGPNAVGYGFALNYDGTAAAVADGGGDARTIADSSPALDFDETTEMEIASVSKSITAVALLHLIQTQITDGTFESDDPDIQAVLDDDDATIEMKVSAVLNTKLSEYVPQGWTAGANVDSVTLRHLLTHRSGFLEGDPNVSGNANGAGVNFNSFSQNTWANIRDLYEADLPAPDTTFSDTGDECWRWSYNNANFTILAKVVIPKIIGLEIAVDDGEDLLTDDGLSAFDEETGVPLVDSMTGLSYRNYVQDDMFAPLGLSDVSMNTDNSPGDDVLAYNSTDPAATNGGAMSDLLSTGGAFGWKMSAEELATFLDGVRHDDSILEPDVRDMMFDRLLGWTAGNDEFGDNFGKGGTQRRNGNQMFRTQVGVFEGGVEVAVLMNSEDAALPYRSISESTKEAYHQAFTHIVYDGTRKDDNFTIALANSGIQPVLEVYRGATLVLSQWLSTLESLTINGLGGDDKFEIDELPDSVELILNGGDDNDTWETAPNTGNLELVNGVTFNGGDGEDSAIINDANNPYAAVGNNSYFVSADHVRRETAPASVDAYMTGVEHLTLDTGDQSDWVNVFSAAWSLTVNTGDGADTIEGSTLYEDMSAIDGLVVNGGDGVDKLTIDDEQNAYPHADSGEYVITESVVERGDRRGAITVSMSSIEELGLTTGTGNDVVQIDSIPRQTTIHTRDGEDAVYVESTDSGTQLELYGNGGTDTFFVAENSHDLTPVAGAVHVHGDDGFGSVEAQIEYLTAVDDDQVYVYDDSNPESGDFDISRSGGALFTGNIVRYQPSKSYLIPFQLTYDQIEQTYLYADDGENIIDVIGAPKFNQVRVYAGGGIDEIYVHETPEDAEMFIYGEGGADSIGVSPVGRNLDNLASTLYVDGGGNANDRLYVYDYEFVGATPYTLNALSLWRSDESATVDRRVRYAGVERMEVYLNDQNNTFDVVSTAPGTTTYLEGYQGDDVLTVWAASSPIEFSGGSEAVGTDNDRAIWVGSESDDSFTVAGDTIYQGDGSLTTHDDVESRHVDGDGGTDLLRIEDVEGENELFHIRPDGLDPYHGQVEIGNWLPVNYRFEDVVVAGNASDVDRLRLDGLGLEEDYFDIHLAAHGTHNSPLATVSVAEGELLRLRSASGLSSGGSLLTPAIEIHALAQYGEFNVIAPDGAPVGNPTAISVFGDGDWAALNVTYTTGANVEHQLPDDAIPGQVSVDYNDLAYDVTYYDVDEVALHEMLPGDFDADGVADAIEDLAPNGGDGNNDGMLDSQQENVASLPNAADGSFVTIAAPDGLSVQNVAASPQPTGGIVPADPTQFPLGFFEFTVTGLPVGGSAVVDVIPESNVQLNTYHKFGPEPSNTTPHEYAFLFDGTTGAELLPDRIRLHLVDGDRGDHDLQQDGIIVDPSAPGFHPALKGDMDLDEDVDFDDIDDFVLGLTDSEAYEALYGLPSTFNGDIDMDGDQDFDDIDDFVGILTGGLLSSDYSANTEASVSLQDVSSNSRGMATGIESTTRPAEPPIHLGLVQNSFANDTLERNSTEDVLTLTVVGQHERTQSATFNIATTLAPKPDRESSYNLPRRRHQPSQNSRRSAGELELAEI